MKKITFLALFAALGLVAQGQISRYIKVIGTGDSTGTSWSNASGRTQIQARIDEVAGATNQGTVYFAAGTYLIGAQIQLKNNVQLMGGYSADGSGTRDLLNNQTILDGQFNKRILYTGDNSPIAAFTKITKVDGFVLQRGSSSYGSAAAISLGTVLENCIIRNNNGSTQGAAIFIKRHYSLSSPTTGWNMASALINCVIVNNTSSNLAAAIFTNDDSHFNVINCTIANNKSTDATGGVGGLLFAKNIRYARVSNNIFYNNSSPVTGRNNFYHTGTDALAAVFNNYFFESSFPNTNITALNGNKLSTDVANPGFAGATGFQGHDAAKMPDIALADWRLTSTSGLIGSGSALSGRADITYPYSSPYFNSAARAFSTVTNDVQGSSRVINTTVEMGAYEYNPVTSNVSSSNINYGTVNANQEASKGSSITQTATPASGYHFVNWTENGTEVSTNASYKFTAISNRTLVANFEPNTIALSSGITNASTISCTTCDVTVASGAELTVGADKTLKSITLAAGGKLTLSSGTLSASNGITLQNTASGTASFVDERTADNPTAITGTVEQTITETNRNWYVAIPVSGKTASDITLSGAKIVQRNEAESRWDDVLSGAGLTPGIGYIAVASASSGTTSWSLNGNLNSGKVEVPVTRSGATSAGFNLLGNPYPSYLNWEQVLSLNATNEALLQPSIWYRTKTVAGYNFQTYNSAGRIATPTTTSGYIPPMQAFWVRANNAGLVTFTNAMRSHGDGSGNMLKAPGVNPQKIIRLQLSNETSSDETVVYFDENAQNNFDKYDTEKMFNNVSSKPELYTKADNEKLVINGLAGVTDQQELPVGVTYPQGGNLKLKITGLSNFDSNTHIWLLDKQENIQTELTPETEYTFSITATTGNESRFSLLFRAPGATTGNVNAESNQVSVFVNAQNEIVINAVEGSRYSVYNTAGQQMAAGKTGSSFETINQQLNNGVYVVRVGSVSKRVIVK